MTKNKKDAANGGTAFAMKYFHSFSKATALRLLRKARNDDWKRKSVTEINQQRFFYYNSTENCHPDNYRENPENCFISSRRLLLLQNQHQ